MLFNTRVNIFRKEFLIKDSIYEVENDISIYIVHKVITIILYSCHIQVHLSGKLHPCGDATSEPYKPAFHGGYLSHSTSYGGAATLWIFRLPRQRYSYSTQSSMTELLLSVSQH